MRLSFYVPSEFHVFGVPQSARPPCVIECDVVELVRVVTLPRRKWFGNRRARVPGHVSYVAYVVLPPWVTPPESWRRLLSGEVQLGVNVALNRRAEIPEFPVGQDRLVIERDAQC